MCVGAMEEVLHGHKGLANKHGMHRMLLEDGSLQRRTSNMQGNDLDTPTGIIFICSPMTGKGTLTLNLMQIYV